MTNEQIQANEGGDFGIINDNYSDRQVEVAIASRAGKAVEKVQALEDEIEQIKNNPDVVDVVDTKADLDNYDTKTLTDKDVIRVLTDETEDGASSYYRWSASTKEWEFVGKVKNGLSETTTFWGQTVKNGVVGGPIYSSMRPLPSAPSYPSAGLYVYSNDNNPVVLGLGSENSSTGYNRGRIQFYGETTGARGWAFLVDNDRVFSAKQDAIDVVKKRVINVLDPTADTDAANKRYVDTAVSTAVGDVEAVLETLTTGTGV